MNEKLTIKFLVWLSANLKVQHFQIHIMHCNSFLQTLITTPIKLLVIKKRKTKQNQ
jgi:hypothetical protein